MFRPWWSLFTMGNIIILINLANPLYEYNSIWQVNLDDINLTMRQEKITPLSTLE
jgi:hypothetical protein